MGHDPWGSGRLLIRPPRRAGPAPAARHGRTLNARSNLAVTLGDLGELDDARAIEEGAAATADRVLGEEHRITLQAKVNLATILSIQGKKSEASSLLTKCLAISLRVFGKQHEISSVIAWRLANSCGPHETTKRRMIIMQNLSWLRTQRPDQLTAEQKRIKNALRGSLPGGTKGSRKLSTEAEY
jgi:hypothetical protein